MIIRLCSIFS